MKFTRFIRLLVCLTLFVTVSFSSMQSPALALGDTSKAVKITQGITHIIGVEGFKTVVKRDLLPESARHFTKISVASSNGPFAVDAVGIEAFSGKGDPYNETGYNSSLPRGGTYYTLTILYDHDHNVLGYSEEVMQVPGKGESAPSVETPPPATLPPPVMLPNDDPAYLKTGIVQITGVLGFKTIAKRAELPAFARDFVYITVATSSSPFGVKEVGMEAYNNGAGRQVYDDRGYNSGVPYAGHYYVLTMLYDAAKTPIGYHEASVAIPGSAGQDTPPPSQTPKHPTDYGSDIDPSYNAPAKQLFTDVGADYWAYSAIADLSTRGVLGGYPDGKFRPDRVVTRAELAKIMVLAAGLDVQKVGQTSFADVKPGDWHAPYVEAAKFYLNGYSLPNGSVIFDPDAPALREDLAVAIVKLKGYDSTHFPDLSVIQAMFTDYT
ncbi:MAG TPA: S-layer homology domain-containing protein, partial [Paenibacillus sp.]|nr:S-layer homology domain-containing protein [Paenibacillus sp.]